MALPVELRALEPNDPGLLRADHPHALGSAQRPHSCSQVDDPRVIAVGLGAMGAIRHRAMDDGQPPRVGAEVLDDRQHTFVRMRHDGAEAGVDGASVGSIAMGAPGRLLAAGRDAEIFEHGPGRVLRKTRDGRSIEHEALVMAHVRAFGFPAPEVFEFTHGGSGMVMERLDGLTMLDALARRPWRLWRYAAVLARLHQQLHLIPAPPGLRQSPHGGDRVLHLDLHPLNVLMTPRGPVVIDWTNAAAGEPDHDVAVSWIILGAADVPSGPTDRLLSSARGLFLQSFLQWFDRDAVAAALPLALEFRVNDANLADHERAAARALVERERGR